MKAPIGFYIRVLDRYFLRALPILYKWRELDFEGAPGGPSNIQST